MKLIAPSAERNRQPIAEVLARVLPASGLVLEVASGSGMHTVHFAARFPALTWQPTDRDPDARESIAEWCAGIDNVRPPLELDASSDDWPVDHADAMVCINMVHIAPWTAAQGLLRGAGRILAVGAPLVTYGPYLIDGETAPSNHAFDASLRSRDPSWGVREVRDLEAEAARHGLALIEIVPMPANNHCLVWRRT